MSHKTRLTTYTADSERYRAHASVAITKSEQNLLNALASLAEESAIYRASVARRYTVDAPGSELDGTVIL